MAALGVVAPLLLAGCSEAQVTHPAPSSTPPPFALGSMPPIGFNHRYGNNPVAAADAFALERSLFSAKQYWEVAMRADPATAGYVEESDPVASRAARARVTSLLLVIASESATTLRQLVALDNAGQQAYCRQLLDRLRAEGYSGLRSADVEVYFGESHVHAKLSWTAAGGYQFTVYDNNLNGALLRPIPSATPFATPPAH